MVIILRSLMVLLISYIVGMRPLSFDAVPDNESISSSSANHLLHICRSWHQHVR